MSSARSIYLARGCEQKSIPSSARERACRVVSARTVILVRGVLGKDATMNDIDIDYEDF